MKHYIKDNIYYLTEDNGCVVLSLRIDGQFENQIVITTAKEVYAGPVDYLSFWSDVPNHELK